jgi:hypothetical protein
MRLLIMHFVDDPFDPHEIKTADRAREDAFAEHLRGVGERGTLADDIGAAFDRSVLFGYRAVVNRLQRLGPRSVLVGAVVALAASPVVALGIGMSAGFAGAAAIAYGFAVLGGGSIAAGGYGIVGGMVAAPVAGAIVGGGSSTFVSLAGLDQEAFEGELRNEAALFHLLFVQRPGSTTDAQPWIQAVEQRVQDFRNRLQTERSLSDPGSRPLKSLEKRTDQLPTLARWMIEQTKQKI